MSVWNYLFDSEYFQRRDIESLRDKLTVADITIGDVDQQLNSIRKVLATVQQQQNRLELVLEGLIELLQVKKQLSRDELGVMVQRLDLADGLEDGRIGPDKSAGAPKCPFCGRPRNPKREQCIFCNETIKPEDLKLVEEQSAKKPEAEKQKIRTVRCANCGKKIPEAEAFFAENGMICRGCSL